MQVLCVHCQREFIKDFRVAHGYYFLNQEFHKLISSLDIRPDKNLCAIFFYFKFVFELCSTDKEMHKRQDMLSNLKSKAKQMATSFNMSNFANRSAMFAMILIRTCLSLSLFF